MTWTEPRSETRWNPAYTNPTTSATAKTRTPILPGRDTIFDSSALADAICVKPFAWSGAHESLVPLGGAAFANASMRAGGNHEHNTSPGPQAITMW